MAILDTVHKTAKGLHDAGVMDTQTMREFDALSEEAQDAIWAEEAAQKA